MFITCGDFNAHLGYLGHQTENENGKLVNQFIEESGLILMNLDDKCSGTYTWERGEWKSAIDLVLSKENIYGKCKKITIDEKRECIDISDHCMIIIEMEMDYGKGIERKQWKETYFYNSKEKKMDVYRSKVEEKLMELHYPSMREINEIIKELLKNT